MPGDSVIETGVDKLVQLIKQNKTISVPEAAKTLGVSTVVIEEWANFLEEEGIIGIEYKFTTPYLVERALSKTEFEEKAVEFQGKKEGFIRKAEVFQIMMDKKGDLFHNVKEDFNRLKKELSSDLETVNEELKLLDKYNTEKRDIDTEIKQQEKEFKEKIHQMESQIMKEREKYSEVLKDISSEQACLDKEKINALSMKKMLSALDKSMSKLDITAAKIKVQLSSEEKRIDNSQQHISRLKQIASSAKIDVRLRQKQMKDLLKKSHLQQQKIIKLQDTILAKVKKKKILLQSQVIGGHNAASKFKRFFLHNKKIEDYLNKIDKDESHLKTELQDLIKKSKAFHLLSKSKDIRKYITELEKRFKEIESGKKKFEVEISKLRSITKKGK